MPDAASPSSTQLPGVWGGAFSYRRGADHYYLLPDLQGHTRQLTNAAGAIFEPHIYDAWGREIWPIVTTEPYLRGFGQFGYWRYTATREYVRVRHLRVEIGRWVSRDPVPVTLRSATEYSYVASGPCGLPDPSGLVTCAQLVSLRDTALVLPVGRRRALAWWTFYYHLSDYGAQLGLDRASLSFRRWLTQGGDVLAYANTKFRRDRCVRERSSAYETCLLWALDVPSCTRGTRVSASYEASMWAATADLMAAFGGSGLKAVLDCVVGDYPELFKCKLIFTATDTFDWNDRTSLGVPIFRCCELGLVQDSWAKEVEQARLAKPYKISVTPWTKEFDTPCCVRRGTHGTCPRASGALYPDDPLEPTCLPEWLLGHSCGLP